MQTRGKSENFPMIHIIKYILAIFFLDQVIQAILKKSNIKWKKYIFLSFLVLLYGISYEFIVKSFPQNYFQALSIERIFTEKALKKSYRKQAVQYHPDKDLREGSHENIFEEITLRYETLASTESRLLYDYFGPEGTYLIQQKKREIDPLQLFYNKRTETLRNDGIFYLLFGISFIAMSSDESLKVCRKICFMLIFAFFALEVSFLWNETPSYDIFDSIFPGCAIFERIYVLKAYIGIICITLKTIFISRTVKPESLIMEKLGKVKKLQEKISSQTKSTDPNGFVKTVSSNPELKEDLVEINKLMKETAQICEENSIEKKKEMKVKRKRKIKASIMSILIFVWAYYFFH